MDCDFIAIGSSVYLGKLQITQRLSSNLAAIRDKKIFFFQVAGTPPDQKENWKRISGQVCRKNRDQKREFFFMPEKWPSRSFHGLTGSCSRWGQG